MVSAIKKKRYWRNRMELCLIDSRGDGWKWLLRCPRVVLAHILIYIGYRLFLYLLAFLISFQNNISYNKTYAHHS